jgi:hypothetical protein
VLSVELSVVVIVLRTVFQASCCLPLIIILHKDTETFDFDSVWTSELNDIDQDENKFKNKRILDAPLSHCAASGSVCLGSVRSDDPSSIDTDTGDSPRDKPLSFATERQE